MSNSGSRSSVNQTKQTSYPEDLFNYYSLAMAYKNISSFGYVGNNIRLYRCCLVCLPRPTDLLIFRWSIRPSSLSSIYFTNYFRRLFPSNRSLTLASFASLFAVLVILSALRRK